MIQRIVIINGPNLNLLGMREPDIYGSVTFEDYLGGLRSKFEGVRIEYFQSNHEGQIIDWLHAYGFHAHGVILNAGGYAHTSVAIRDAVEAIKSPVVGVHISDIYAREAFRHVDLLTDVCVNSIVGKGLDGYEEALQMLIKS
ncbi:MAG: 3-dehydroquinate dehydratase [Bacteroidetes bacterium]|nr:MAG: 3-dehydroquinate dehydratase [Bacteroidota bacterium]